MLNLLDPHWKIGLSCRDHLIELHVKKMGKKRAIRIAPDETTKRGAKTVKVADISRASPRPFNL